MCGCSGTPDQVVDTVIIITAMDSCSVMLIPRRSREIIEKWLIRDGTHFRPDDNGAAQLSVDSKDIMPLWVGRFFQKAWGRRAL
jgi:hypothetical protein